MSDKEYQKALDLLERDIRVNEREKTLDEFIEWLYQRGNISFHEKQNMKEWFLAEQPRKAN